MRGKTSGTLAVIAAAWAAAPTIARAQLSAAEGTGLLPQTGRVVRPIGIDRGLHGVGGFDLHATPAGATDNTTWVGGEDDFDGVGNLIPAGSWNIATNWNANTVPNGG